MSIINNIKIFIAKKAFNTKVRLGIFKKLSTFIDSNIPLLDVLKILYEEYSKGDNATDPRGFVLKQWYIAMDRDAKSLSEAMNGWIPSSENVLISSGEKSSNLSLAFKNCIKATEATSSMTGIIIGKLIYPVILMSLLCAAAVGFALKIVPVLVKVADPATWPSVSQDLYTISIFIVDKGAYVLMGLITTGIIISWSLSRLTGPIRTILDKIPPYSMYKSFQSSLTLVSLSSLLNSGVPIKEALALLYNQSNPYIKSHLLKIIHNVNKEGKKLGESFDVPFFDYETKVDIAVYSRATNIGENMAEIGSSAIQNGIERVSAVAYLINLLSIFAIAGYICWAYYGFFSVMQNVGSNF